MWAIFAFLEKRPLTEVVVKFSKLCSESFTASPIDVLFKCRNICPTENRWNRRYLRTNKKNSAASQTVATAWIAPKICQGQPATMCSQYSRFHTNRLTFGGVIAERVNTVNYDTTNITGDESETSYLFQQMSIALQRGNAVSFQSTFTAS